MDSIRSPAPAYFGSELARETAGSPYEPHEPLAAAAFCPQPEPSGAAQEDFLRTGHYTVVTATRHTDLTHQAADKDGEATFCVQGVAAFAAGTSELEKAMPTDQQYMIPELGGAAYQLGSDGDVYNLVVREAKPDDVSAEQLATHYGQLLPDPLAGAPEAADKQKEPPAPSHCLVCDMQMGTHPALDVFTNTTHQTSTTYAIKLRQVTGHRANFAYHSEVICESCASLLNVVDSFEARLREIKARLEDTRAEVQAKFSRTCVRYDAQAAEEPEQAVPEEQTAAAVQQAEKRAARLNTRKKRPQTEDTSRVKKKAAKDESFKVKIGPQDTEEVSRRRSSTRTVERPRTGAESDEDDPEVADSAGGLHEQPEQDQDQEEEEEDSDDSEGPIAADPLSDPRPVRVANMCAECGRLFINPMVLRVHQLAHQQVPLPPQTASAADYIPVLELDNYGAADVLAQAVQQMNSAAEQERPAPEQDAKPADQKKPQKPDGEAAAAPAEAVQEVFKCDSCSGLFRTLQGLQKHHRKLHSQSVWRCYVCWQAVDSMRRLKRHIATHGEKNSCAVCLQPFDSKVLLKLHVTRKHPETQTKNNYCELCNKHFDNQGFLEHARGVHGVGGDPGRRFKCGQCGKTLLNSVCYVRHMKVHKKNFNCQYCGKSFNNRTNLDNHERTHTGEKPYFCPDCERSFTSKQVRDIHIRTFHRQNPYACKRCNRRCESKASFIRHMRSHAGVTPFECPVCCKRMTTEYSLKMHIRAIHDRTLPFKCDICQKAFPYKSSLTLHLNTHSGDKSHICDICGKCFASRGSLRTHMHTHSADKPYKCEWCERSFSRKDLLAGHKLQIHGIQPEMNYSRLTKH